MKTAIIVGILGLLLVAGFVTVTALQDSPDVSEEVEYKSCSGSCGNFCTSESNCGKATCGATTGKTCGGR